MHTFITNISEFFFVMLGLRFHDSGELFDCAIVGIRHTSMVLKTNLKKRFLEFIEFRGKEHDTLRLKLIFYSIEI